MSCYIVGCFNKSCFLFQRLEEIMRRTRRTDSPDTVRFTVQFLKSTLPRGSYDAQPASSNNSAQPHSLSLTESVLTQKPVPVRILPNGVQPKENTEPVHNGSKDHDIKSSQLRLNNEEDMVPIVAFKERRSLRTLTGLEEIQTHQRAGETQTSRSLV